MKWGLAKYEIVHNLLTRIVATKDDNLYSYDCIVAVYEMDAMNKDKKICSNRSAFVFSMPILCQWEEHWPVCKPELP